MEIPSDIYFEIMYFFPIFNFMALQVFGGYSTNIARFFDAKNQVNLSKTSTLSPLIYSRLNISFKKVLFQFHYNHVELYVVILRLA